MKLKLLAIALAFAGISAHSLAATPPQSVTYKGITLTPAIANVEVAPDEASSSFKIKVENKQDTPVSLVASSLDFKSLNDTGGVAFIGSNTSALEHKYGLANWIGLPAGDINLKPNTSQEVTVTIDNRADLSPGGHYAAILFRTVGSTGGGSNKVNLNQVVATLVFLKKSGGEIYSLNLQKPHLKTVFFGLPSNLDLFIKNTGNTQTIPRGVVSVTGPNGKQYERGILNPDSGLVLPDSTRLYRTEVFKTGHSWLPGKYTAEITYRSQDLKSASTAQYSFFYLNIFSVALLIIIIVIILWLARRLKHKFMR